ncbi:hypothetical protein CFC21_032456 [Triticum aestivum]|uniref:Uncharacterized protein n=2 Tax=Triticum aestivum TaxID=4565 RepID=A0A3B6DMY1_WHEAT|nr:uncharacterized protein LOC123055022 [Triticum aestivum]XP_044334856.1 uncharacterized protein LOC123055022 [Triticum aestivum]XP_044334857.1 uncharacterized protein LOC123055022 [Triticum aestivum]XP_044334858.1 uncharacterized protein LOC123055022 [Triticum aestivum]KAF7019262.1 hypothetical protein CFC21_032456 [Triticum aestivum]
MASDEETSRVVRALVEKHLESVVSLRAFKEPSEPQLGDEGNQDSDEELMGEEGEEKKEEGESSAPKKEALTPVCYGTGSIIHSCDRFALVFSVAHTFAPFRSRQPGALVAEDTTLLVEFSDGQIRPGHFRAIGWSHDMSLIMVLTNTRYRPVKFIDHSCPAMGFSAHEREARVYSICTYPAERRNALMGTALSGKICGPLRRGRNVDKVFEPELRMCEFVMGGASGCSGAPLFTATRHVMGMWLSQVGECKFAVLVHSICEWLRTTYRFQETSMKRLVPRLASLYLEHLRRVDPQE